MREHEFSTNLHENIRNANSTFAFGSMKAETVNFPSGPQCFKVHGQVYHLANTFFPMVKDSSYACAVKYASNASFAERIFTS